MLSDGDFAKSYQRFRDRAAGMHWSAAAESGRFGHHPLPGRHDFRDQVNDPHGSLRDPHIRLNPLCPSRFSSPALFTNEAAFAVFRDDSRSGGAAVSVSLSVGAHRTNRQFAQIE
jgi:hypothetical protein